MKWPRDSWRLITGPSLLPDAVPPELAAAYAMAVDESIARAFRAGQAPPTLRFYEWFHPALTLGTFQSARELIDWKACASSGIQVVRRITGGGAVFHDRELTYSVVESTDSPFFSNHSIQGTFLALSRAFLRAFRSLHLNVQIHESPETATRIPSCFASPARFEILLNGRKVIGSAQRRWPGAFLQQGSIPLDSDPGRLHAFLRNSKDTIQAGGMAINEGSAEPVTPEGLRGAIVQGMREVLGITFIPDILTEGELKTAVELTHGKYGTEAWNLHRAAGSQLIDKWPKTAKIESYAERLKRT